MRFFRRRIRGIFALQAILLCLLGASGLVTVALKPSEAHFSPFAFTLAFLLTGIVNGIAWWSTRKPSEYRDAWAMGASALAIAEGIAMAWVNHRTSTPAIPGLYGALGIAGLVVFSQGGSPSRAGSGTTFETSAPVIAPAKPRRISGDRTSLWGRRAFGALSFMLEIVTMFLWARWAHFHGFAPSHIPWYFTFTMAVLITAALHECGHALVARHLKMNLMSFSAGTLQWRKIQRKWTFKFDLDGLFSLGGAVGVVATNPKQPRRDELYMIAAGPLANLLAGTTLLLIVVTAHWSHDSQVWRILAYAASFSFIAALTNMLPFRTDCGGYSDGARILQLITNSPLLDYFSTLSAVAATGVTQQRFRDIDIARIERAAALFPNEKEGMHLQIFALLCHQDAGRIPEAKAALAAAERIHDQNPIDLLPVRHTAMVTNHAVLNRNPNAARRWWDRMEAKGVERKNFDYWLAKSSLLWIEGKKADAEDAWQMANLEAQKQPQLGSCDFDRDLCKMMRGKLDGTPSRIRPAQPPQTSPDRPAQQVATRQEWNVVSRVREAVATQGAV